MDEQEARPRYGRHWSKETGNTKAIYFAPHPDIADGFIATDPATAEPLIIDKGDRVYLDTLTDGQITFVVYRDQGFVASRTEKGWKESRMEDKQEKKPASGKSALIGLATLGGFAGIVILSIAGIRWALGL